MKHFENKNGMLFIGECNALELVKRYGTPLYVYDEQRIQENTKRIMQVFQKHYKKTMVFYAVKANNNPVLMHILKEEGCGADISNPEEMHIALKSGISKEHMLCSAVFPSDEELQWMLKNKITMHIGDFSEVKRLLSFEVPKIFSVRINPGAGNGRFKGLITGGSDAKFGISPQEALEAYVLAKNAGVNHFGIHMMTGSCILDEKYFEEITKKLFNIAGEIKKKLDFTFDFIDIGGGFGIPYQNEKELNIEYMAKRVCAVFEEQCNHYALGEPFLYLEPGRYLLADAGVLLTKVNAIKRDKKTFVGVDAGMNTLIRPMLYGAYHEVSIANKMDAKPQGRVNIVGPICENTDQFAQDRLFPAVEPGDILAIFDVGAYGFAMSSQYNGKPRAAEVLVKNGNSFCIRKRETLKDVLKNIQIPRT